MGPALRHVQGPPPAPKRSPEPGRRHAAFEVDLTLTRTENSKMALWAYATSYQRLSGFAWSDPAVVRLTGVSTVARAWDLNA